MRAAKLFLNLPSPISLKMNLYTGKAKTAAAPAKTSGVKNGKNVTTAATIAPRSRMKKKYDESF
jgi:hypothetical protein